MPGNNEVRQSEWQDHRARGSIGQRHDVHEHDRPHLHTRKLQSVTMLVMPGVNYTFDCHLICESDRPLTGNMSHASVVRLSASCPASLRNHRSSSNIVADTRTYQLYRLCS